MKFKLFGGLDCPDTLLAQLAVVGNTDIVTLKSLGALADHVMTVMLLTICSNSSSAVGDNTTAGSSSSSTSLAAENEIRTSTIKLFEDVMKPLIQAAAANEAGGKSSSSSVADHRFDNFAVKAVAFHESQRLQRAKAAYAAAKKFVVTATADEIEQLSLQPASLQQQLLIAEDALSQALVALDHVIANVARFNISDEVLHKELTMLGMSPEAVEVILSSVKSSISSFRDRLGEDDAKEKGSAYSTALAFVLGVGDSGNGISAEAGAAVSSPKKVKSGGEEASAGAVLRQIGLYKCPRIGAQSPIGAIIPFVRTSTLAAVQTITSSAEDAEGEKEEEDASKVQAEAEEALTDLDSGASSTAIIKLFTTSDRNGGAKIIEMSHAQARTLLNELLVVRDIMRGGDAHHE